MSNQLPNLVYRLGSRTLMAITLAVVSAPLAMAQVTQPTNPAQFENNAEKDPYFGTSSNSSDFSLFNLMRNAQQGTQRSPNELIEEQQEDWQKGIDDFRRQQLEKLGTPANTQPNVAPKTGK